jgi:uncharacterized lipoprotein
MTDRPGRRALLLAVLAVVSLAGCASDPRYASGLDWVTGQSADRARLEAQGFPQFTGPN